jgi:uncharacterized protein YndB with AHSA1/START domain
MPAAISTQEITITRVFDAPRELVWKAWTEPDQLAQWWGPLGWTNRLETIEMDVRPGGAFRVTSVSDEDGTEMTTSGAYREVLEPERLVLEEPGKDAWHENAVSVVTLTDLGDGRTEIVLHATIQTTEELRAHAEAGMAASLDRLAEHLA